MAVTHDEAQQRFKIETGGEEATLVYRKSGDKIVFVHTEVPPELEGKGFGGELARAGLEYARASHLSVVPQCPFIATYLQRHKEYADLVAPDKR